MKVTFDVQQGGSAVTADKPLKKCTKLWKMVHMYMR